VSEVCVLCSVHFVNGFAEIAFAKGALDRDQILKLDGSFGEGLQKSFAKLALRESQSPLSH
jgi:hypothetical protein